MLTARMAPGWSVMSSGSDSSGAPAGIRAPGLPSKLSWRLLPATRLPLAALRPIQTAPTCRAVVPKVFDRRTRTRAPPMLVQTMRRRVWLLKDCTDDAVGGPAGAVPQVAHQLSLVPAARAAPGGSASPAASAEAVWMNKRRPGRGG